MGTTTAIIIGTSAAANAANAQNSALRNKFCRKLIDDFTGKESIEVKQDYADCINRLYSKPLEGGEIIIAKIFIILAITGSVVGFFKCRDSENIVAGTLGGFLGLIILPFAGLFVWGIYEAIKFLFT